MVNLHDWEEKMLNMIELSYIAGLIFTKKLINPIKAK